MGRRFILAACVQERAGVVCPEHCQQKLQSLELESAARPWLLYERKGGVEGPMCAVEAQTISGRLVDSLVAGEARSDPEGAGRAGKDVRVDKTQDSVDEHSLEAQGMRGVAQRLWAGVFQHNSLITA